MKIKVGVFFGGKSVEHEVSVISGIQALNAFDREKYDPIPIYITKENEMYTGEAIVISIFQCFLQSFPVFCYFNPDTGAEIDRFYDDRIFYFALHFTVCRLFVCLIFLDMQTDFQR